MNLDEQLEDIESMGETELEYVDQQTQWQDFESDEDEILGPDAMETDLERAYDSFMTNNEADYDGWDLYDIEEEVNAIETSDILHSEGYHIEEFDTGTSELLETEIELGEISNYIVNGSGEKVGFAIEDSQGREYHYIYISEDNDSGGVVVKRYEDGAQFDLALGKDYINTMALT